MMDMNTGQFLACKAINTRYFLREQEDYLGVRTNIHTLASAKCG
jgi:hypothetical protein